MSRIHPECPGSVLSDHSVGADALVRQEPEKDEDDGKRKDDDDDNDENNDGNSE